MKTYPKIEILAVLASIIIAGRHNSAFYEPVYVCIAMLKLHGGICRRVHTKIESFSILLFWTVLLYIHIQGTHSQILARFYIFIIVIII